MELTLLIAKILGPVLLLRGASILINRAHFVAMADGLEHELTTVAFSMFPIALFMTCLAVVLTHRDASSLAALMIHVIAWGGLVKSAALIVWPGVVARKARLLVRGGYLYLVTAATVGLGAYFTWFGYFSSR